MGVALAAVIIVVIAGLSWRQAPKDLEPSESGSSSPSGDEPISSRQETPKAAVGTAGLSGQAVTGESRKEAPVEVVALKDRRVVIWEERAAAFERDAADFRRNYPVYDEFLDCARNTLVPMLIEGRRAFVELHTALGLEKLGHNIYTPGLEQLRQEMYRKYTYALWLGMVFDTRGLMLADFASELSDIAQSGEILVDEKDREWLARLTKTFTHQKKTALEGKWPRVEEVIEDRQSLDYKMFVAYRGAVMVEELLVKVAGALPEELEERRKELDRERRSLEKQRLIVLPPRSEYVDAYRKALQDEFARVYNEVDRLEREKKRKVTEMIEQAERSIDTIEIPDPWSSSEGTEEE